MNILNAIGAMELYQIMQQSNSNGATYSTDMLLTYPKVTPQTSSPVDENNKNLNNEQDEKTKVKHKNHRSVLNTIYDYNSNFVYA